MSEFTITRQINAPITTVFDVLDDFGNIADWSGGVKRSYLTTDGPVGEGTSRHCDFVPMGGVNERITAYVPNQRMTVHLYELFKMPASDAVADFKLSDAGEQTELMLDVSYTPNRLGRAAKKMTAKQMHKGMNALADDLVRHSERAATSSTEEAGHGAA